MKDKHKPTCDCVMLIDDNEIDNFINQKMIEGCNFSQQVQVYSSSQSALDFLENLQKIGATAEAMKPKVIFLDINMPMMDGFQFLNEFEKLSKDFIKNIKIAIVSTSVNPSDTEQAEANDHVLRFVTKPLTEQQLTEIAAQLADDK